MGEVYREYDTKLKREIAIKVLPEAFAQDAERLARFQREAQVLASLSHPNITAVYEVRRIHRRECLGDCNNEIVRGPRGRKPDVDTS